MVFPKGAAPAHDLSCIIWKDGIFFPKTWSFCPGQKAKDGLSQQEIHGNMMHRPAKKKQETWYIESKIGVSLNLSGWRYSTMNNLQCLVPFSTQGPCFRSNYQGCSVKKGGLRNFAKFTGKHLCQSLFLIKLLVPAALLKKRPWYRFFPVNFATFFREHIWATAFGVWGHAWVPTRETIYP